MTASDPARRIGTEVDARREQLVSLTQDLVRIPTVNPPGNHYREICDYVGGRLERSGYRTELLRAEGAPGDSDAHPRWNLVARREGSRPGDTVHFNSHHDVVEVGSGWTIDPFGGEVRDGRVYGRGTCDMKGGLAASIIAAEAFAAAVPEHAGAIEISATADEESGGYGGVAWLAERGYFSPDRVQHVIIPEPLNKDRICLGHRGVWWAEIETHGRIAHGSMPFLGDSAIRHMGAVLAEIEATLYPALAERQTAMPVVPPQARQSTLNINSIHGGQQEPEAGYTGFPAPVVAHSARIVIDRRYLIEESPAAVRQEVVDLLETLKSRRAGFSYEIRDLWTIAPTMTEKEAPVVRSVAKAIGEVMGVGPQYVVSPGTYDQKHIDRIGRLKNCIAYGPGILDLAHQPDEWVGIDDMLDSAKVMALTLLDLLGQGAMNRPQAAIGTTLFFFAAPGIVGGVIPWAITGWRLPDPLPLSGIPAILGVALLLPGLWVLIDSFVRFARNLGTPAPIAPTQRLVVDGWYRYVRNPMYVAVIAIIVGQALLFASWPVLIFAIGAFLVVHLFVLRYEEPTLRRQFPDDYPDYFAHVPRWIPRLRPWHRGQN